MNRLNVYIYSGLLAHSRRVRGLGTRPKGSRGVKKSADVAAGA